MLRCRHVLAACLSVSLLMSQYSVVSGASPPLGILTQANNAYLDQSVASPGLSVFDGERLWTGAAGQLGVRAGHAIIGLAAKTDATLARTGDGVHVDLAAGSLYFSSPENEAVDVHAEEAMLRPEGSQPIQARVTIFAPKVLQDHRARWPELQLSRRVPQFAGRPDLPDLP